LETWADVQRHITRYRLPYSILRFNMSLQGRLIDTATGATLADTVKAADAVLKGGGAQCATCGEVLEDTYHTGVFFHTSPCTGSQ
jgi:hypothetical protein